MRDNFCKGVRYPKEGIDVKDVDYFYTKGGYNEPEIVWVYPQEYLLRDLIAKPDRAAGVLNRLVLPGSYLASPSHFA